jgi:hypothetical protein
MVNGKNQKVSELSIEQANKLQELKSALLDEFDCSEFQTIFIIKEKVSIYLRGRVFEKNTEEISENSNSLIEEFDTIMEVSNDY